MSHDHDRQDKLPLQHLAVIMDGNGRWAQKRGLARSAGHSYGAEKLYDLCAMCIKRRINYVTVFAFSTENWRRPQAEVEQIMDLFIYFFNKYKDEMEKEGIRIRFSGVKDALSDRVKDTIAEAESTSVDRKTLQLILAFNYGSRREIVDSSKKIVAAVQKGELDLDDLDEEKFRDYLYLPDAPDPDLILRPSGEQRLSNFLLWQGAYSELYFAKVLWPDFTEETLDQALKAYAKRDRRFGAIEEE